MKHDSDKSPQPGGTWQKLANWGIGSTAIIITLLATWLGIASYREKAAQARESAQLPSPSSLIIDDKSGSANWAPGTFHLRAPDGISQTSDHSWSVKGSNAFMQVRRLDNESLEMRFVYPLNELLSSETNACLQVRWTLHQDHPLAKQFAITQAQIARLQAISPVTDIAVKTTDRENLSNLFRIYLNTPDKNTENALVDGVIHIDEACQLETIRSIGNIASQVKQVFTQDQWNGLVSYFNTPAPNGSRRIRER